MELGKNGPWVSELGFGAMGMSHGYGPAAPEGPMIELLHEALDLGITFFDTAECYGPYANEILLGKAFRGSLPTATPRRSPSFVVAAPLELLEDFERLLCLLDRPEQIAVRAPLPIRDIHYLLLTDSPSACLRSLYAPRAAGQPEGLCGSFGKTSGSASPSRTLRRRQEWRPQPSCGISRRTPRFRPYSSRSAFGSGPAVSPEGRRAT